jgi:hypothetical protein
MPTLGTQNISTSYPQLLKTLGLGGLPSAGAVEVITDGDNTSSALSIGIDAVQSTGSFTVSSNSSLLGPVTFGTSLTASTGTATIGTLSVGTATISTATISTASISTATIPLQLGSVTFGSNITASTGIATIGTLSASTATISTATIPLQLGAVTFGSTITASTGTNTLGTISVNTATIGTITNTGGMSVTTTATVGTLEIGATGPSITNASYGTAAFSLSTVAAHNGAGTTNGTVALTGAQNSDIVIGTLNSLGSATGSSGLIIGFHCIANNVVRYSITNPTGTTGTVPAGTLHMTALRFTA